MPSLTIDDIPEMLYESLKNSAESHQRTLSGEVIACMEKTLVRDRLWKEEILRQADEIRGRLNVPPLTEEFLREAKNWGRE